MSISVLSQGTLFKVESGASAGTFTTVPEVTKIAAPNVKFDLIDVTSHDSVGGWREYKPGLLDGEAASIDFFLVPSNAVHIQLRTDQYARTQRNFEIIFPGGGTGTQMAVAAYIQSLSPQAGIGDVIKNTMSYKITGQPVWT